MAAEMPPLYKYYMVLLNSYDIAIWPTCLWPDPVNITGGLHAQTGLRRRPCHTADSPEV